MHFLFFTYVLSFCFLQVSDVFGSDSEGLIDQGGSLIGRLGNSYPVHPPAVLQDDKGSFLPEGGVSQREEWSPDDAAKFFAHLVDDHRPDSVTPQSLAGPHNTPQSNTPQAGTPQANTSQVTTPQAKYQNDPKTAVPPISGNAETEEGR